ncbi:2Fe-2S iron-sulfur cluster-binding protein [Nonomuraea sp. NPDC050786]|uniref:(2Fe-2S)-binding protein n=1 Tax=Nonomuraea sp. NPDC050786 TaxID=3154840 RepID=UPI0033CD9923
MEHADPADSLVAVAFTANGTAERLRADPRTTLLDTLRERLELTGTKKGCDRGQCGACDRLHPVQRAFIDCDGFQRGFCTSGQIMSAVAVLREGHAQTDAEIREAGLAVANAVHNATGKRVRDLPVTLDKLL